MSSTIPTEPQARRDEIATLLALGIVRLRKRQHQRNHSPDNTKPLDFDVDLWTDSTGANP